MVTTSSNYVNNRPKENVWSYPRPPALEKVPLRLRVTWFAGDGTLTQIADTTEGFRVLETSHPPQYYFPRKDVNDSLLTKDSKMTFCEWKGRASYWNLSIASSNVKQRIWSYDKPTEGTKFGPLAGYMSFYASHPKSPDGSGWKCFVEDEGVKAQEGDFYGGWVTDEIQGKMKGAPGTWGW